jgi:hypothetical protein
VIGVLRLLLVGERQVTPGRVDAVLLQLAHRPLCCNTQDEPR